VISLHNAQKKIVRSNLLLPLQNLLQSFKTSINNLINNPNNAITVFNTTKSILQNLLKYNERGDEDYPALRSALMTGANAFGILYTTPPDYERISPVVIAGERAYINYSSSGSSGSSDAVDYADPAYITARFAAYDAAFTAALAALTPSGPSGTRSPSGASAPSGPSGTRPPSGASASRGGSRKNKRKKSRKQRKGTR
jgi:hypothetical protein